jgi:hypothetical protein
MRRRVPAPGGRYHQTRNLKGHPIHRIHRTEHGNLRTQTHRCLPIHPAFLIGDLISYQNNRKKLHGDRQQGRATVSRYSGACIKVSAGNVRYSA